MAKFERALRAAKVAKEFGEGVRDEGSTAMVEARRAFALARRSFDDDPEVREAQRAENARLIQQVRANPVPVVRKVATTIATPIRAELAKGRPAAAAGRATVLLAGLVLPGVGAEKLVRLADEAGDTVDGDVVDVDILDEEPPPPRRHRR